jgi:hypothetical protein
MLFNRNMSGRGFPKNLRSAVRSFEAPPAISFMKETEKERDENRQRWYRYAAYTVAALSFFVAIYIARASLSGLASESLASSLVWFVINISVAAVFCAAGLLLDVHSRLDTVDDLKSALARLEARIGAEVLPVGQWDLKTVQSLLESATAGDEVRIWITFFVDFQKMDSIVRRLIDDGVKIQILMMNPGNEGLVRSRFRLRTSYRQNPPLKAQDTLRDQFRTFQDIAKETMGRKGSLEIRQCDTMPFGVFYQIGHQVMLLGLFLSVETWEEGPLIKFYPGSPQWKVLSQNWSDCWENPLDAVP